MSNNRRGSHRYYRKSRVLLVERLDTRIALAADAIEYLSFGGSDTFDFAGSVAEVGRTRTTASSPSANSAPSVAKPIETRSSTDFASKRIPLTVLGADDQGERRLSYQWSKVSGPGNVIFSANNRNSAKRTNATFTAAGDYVIRVTIRDAAGLETRTDHSITIVPKLTQVVVEQGGRTFRNGARLAVSGTAASFQLVALDQFGNPMQMPSEATWTYSAPRSANPVVNGGNRVDVTFDRVGNYQFRTIVSGRTTIVNLQVSQTLSSIAIQPVDSLVPGKSVQLRATGHDQFGDRMSRTPRFTWSTSAGAINSSGRLIAPRQTGAIAVTAMFGSVRTTSTIAVQPLPNFGGFQDAQIASLVQRYFADGSITRPEMIAILRQAGVDGSVSTSELSDFRKLVQEADNYGIPDYVRSLAEDVVHANPANATYQGKRLGNLAAGSTRTHLNQLIDKWFLGTDRPTLTSSSYVYRVARGSLFSGDPSYLDQNQGALGDCYLVSALGTIAMTEPDAIRNMFIDNRDGTFTVRFYADTYGAYYSSDGSISDGFRTGTGVADYVTVDSWLPANSTGRFVYSNAGDTLSSTSNILWLALAEKAYAQWNATGNTGRSVVANSFAAIEGGWMSRFNAQVLGYNSNNYTLTNANKQRLIDALANDRAVTFGTRDSGQSGTLVGSHAYGIIGYDAASDRFTLHNPWGSFHPAPMSYAQLQSTGTYFVVADASRFSTNVTTLSVRQVRGEEGADLAGLAFVETTINSNLSEDATRSEDFVTVLGEQDAAFVTVAGPVEFIANGQWLPAELSCQHESEQETASAADAVFASLDALDELFAELSA